MVLDSKEYRELASVLDLQKYKEWSEIVEDYLAAIRKRINNAWALYKVQESLVILDYNRAWIGVLGDKEPIGKIEPSTSLLNELTELYNHTVTDDNLALLNDITNVIRISDITLRTRNGKYALHEVKSSDRQNKRTKKQRIN